MAANALLPLVSWVPAAITIPLSRAPNAPSALTLRAPALTLTLPVNVLAPLSVNVPVPAFLKPALPATAEAVFAEAVVVTVGVVPPSVSVDPLSV